MRAVACGDLFSRRWPKVVETNTVTRDARQQSASGRRPINSDVLVSFVPGRIYCLPRRLPQRIDSAMLVRN